MISELSSLDLKFDHYYKSDNWKFITFDDLFPNIQNDMKRFEKIAKNRSVYLWGAATKGCLFLAHCTNNNLLINNIRFVVDQNPQKIGKYLPGSLIEIKSRDDFFKEAKSGDVLLISNPAYKDEIVKQINVAGLFDVLILNI